MYHFKLFYYDDIFRKKVLGGCTSRIFFIMQGLETEWRRLGDVARGMETVSRGLGGHSANLEARS